MLSLHDAVRAVLLTASGPVSLQRSTGRYDFSHDNHGFGCAALLRTVATKHLLGIKATYIDLGYECVAAPARSKASR